MKRPQDVMIGSPDSSGFQLGMILPARGHLAMSGDIWGCHNWEGVIGSECVETRSAVKHPTLYKVAPYSKSYQTQSVNNGEVENPGIRAGNQENKVKAEMPLITQVWQSSILC